ncbi:MAG: DUF58 domain-containing protein [Phycisphaeraceae bacterium]
MTQAHSAAGAPHPEHRYLRLADLQRFRQLQFTPRRRVEGTYAGRHASPMRGRSVEFTDYREYIPGDEMVDVDWKVYGRSDRLYVKLFEHQTDLRLHLLIDGSASMAYRGVDADPSATRSWVANLTRGPGRRDNRAPDTDPVRANPSKYDQACLLAAAIAYLTLQQQDRVGLSLARQGLAEAHRPVGAFTHLRRLLHAMEQFQPGGEANLAQALHQAAEHTPRRGTLILFSDLMEDRAEILNALTRFTHRGGEVIVFHVLHADELHLPDGLEEAVFHDSETGGRMRLNVPDIRATYQQRLREMIDGWRDALRTRRMDYNLVSTATPYHRALEGYLVNRARTR